MEIKLEGNKSQKRGGAKGKEETHRSLSVKMRPKYSHWGILTSCMTSQSTVA